MKRMCPAIASARRAAHWRRWGAAVAMKQLVPIRLRWRLL